MGIMPVNGKLSPLCSKSALRSRENDTQGKKPPLFAADLLKGMAPTGPPDDTIGSVKDHSLITVRSYGKD